MFQKQDLHLEQDWDKVFPLSDQVAHHKVTFHNRYGITLAGDVYKPKNVEGKLPGLAVCGPFGAVKEMASGLCHCHVYFYFFTSVDSNGDLFWKNINISFLFCFCADGPRLSQCDGY